MVALAGWTTPQTDDRPTKNQGRTLGAECLSIAATERPEGLALNPAFSRWLMQYPATWDEASPNWADWLAVQEVIASGG
jgi:hypothetical protein